MRETENRVVTVMFVKVSGFNSINVRNEYEIYQLTTQCFDEINSIIASNQGMADEHGNEIRAVFGLPKAIEEAPRKAVKVAEKIRDMVRRFSLNRKLVPSLETRIGINTGHVVVDWNGETEPNNLRGKSVELAANLKNIAQVGQILASSATYQATKDIFQYKELKPKRFEKEEKPTPLYGFVSEQKKESSSFSESDRMIYSEILGREKELNRLEFRVSQLINFKGSIVNIMGEAGSGKSRLIAELKKKEIVSRVKVLEGKAVEDGVNLSFHPISGLLKQWVEIREEDKGGLQLEKLEKFIRNIWPEQLEELLPFIAKIMGVRLSDRYAGRALGIQGKDLERLIIKSARALLRRASCKKPLVIVLDDMQWADDSSIKLLEALFELAEKEKILFINLFRPDSGYPKTSGWLRETANDSFSEFYEEIKLTPLNAENAEEMIVNLLGNSGAPVAFKKQVVEKSGGNPFFIEEIIRSLIDKGAFMENKGRFELDKNHKIFIPLSVNETVTSRLDQLDNEVRQLVKAAAVIGEDFSYEVLLEVADDVEEIEEKLRYLENIQLIRKIEYQQDLKYSFKHGLTREVAYEWITEEDKKELHFQTARSIEYVFKGRMREFYGQTAYHYTQAGELNKALDHMQMAGREAIKASASAEGLKYFQRALEIFQEKAGESADEQKALAIKEDIMEALFNNGDAEALEIFKNILAERYGVKIPEEVSISKKDLLFFAAKLYFPVFGWKKKPTSEDMEKFEILRKRRLMLYSSNFDKAVAEVFLALESLSKLNISKEHSPLTREVVNATWFLNMRGSSLSISLSRKILVWAKPRLLESDKKLLLLYEIASLQYNLFTGNLDQIQRYDQNLVKDNLKLGGVMLVGRYILPYALFAQIRGDAHFFDVELPNVETEILDCNDFFSRSCIFMVKCGYRAFAGKNAVNDEMVKESEAALAFIRKKELKPFELYIGYSLIYTKLLRGDMSGADALFEEMEETAGQMPFIPALYRGLILRVKFSYFIAKLKHSAQGNDERGYELYRKLAFKVGVEAVKEAKKVVFYRTEIFRLMGTFYWEVDKQDKALKWFERSLKTGKALNARVELSRAYFEIGSCLREEGSRHKTLNDEDAKHYLNKASKMFEHLGMDWELDNLNKLKSEEYMPPSKAEKLSKILDLNVLLNRNNDYEIILKIIIREIKEIFSVQSCLIFLNDENESGLSLYYMNGDKDDDLQHITLYKEKGMYGEVLSSGVPRKENAPRENSHFSEEVDELTEVETRNLMAVPLKINERTIGALGLVNKNMGNFIDGDFSFFKDVAEHISIVLNRAKSIEEKIRTERLAGVGETVARLSHSIRNIISSLKGGVGIISKHIDQTSDENVKHAWKITKSGIGEVYDLAIDMLKFSREAPLRFQPCDLNSIIREVIDTFEYSDDDLCKDVEIELNLDPGLEKVDLDQDAIRDCLRNLIRNALQATVGQEERKLVITTQKRGAKQVDIRIQDNGCGIKESDLKKVFVDFFTTKGAKGTGLGLGLVKKLIEGHKGEIKVVSKEGQGTLFIISLPISQDSEK